eukprot:GFUD01032935.1.p1 GENE.GFUD01032935.1~~GFUD01032935.1.p1  ORF type:complete len:255 (+),score=52.84 GFUD01032935.1:13-777(+)
MKSFSTELVILAVCIFSTHETVSGRKLWKSAAAQCDNEFYADMWTATGEVPGKFPEVPPACLDLSYNGAAIQPNDTVITEDMLERPVLGWSTEEGALYTIFIVDYGIERFEGLQYFHWLMANVEDEFGFNNGDEVMDYIPPFIYALNEDGTGLDLTVTGAPLNDIMVMVYKQRSGYVDMADEFQSGCDSSILNNRVADHVAIAEKYNMELVAGNFFFTTYTRATDEILCYFSKCTGEPFPFPAPGVNDGPDCQP